MDEYLDFAKSLANESATIALKYFSFETENTWKEDGTPLTKADTEINDLVIRRIHDRFPEDSIYGEEASDIKAGSKYIWVCDPIDGTMAFSVGLPMFVFSLALVDQSTGQPILGLINDPVMKNMYWAYLGSGAYRNGKKIHVSHDNSFDQTTYSITGGSGKDVGFSNIPFHTLMREKKSRVMKFPSFLYGAIQVANGKFIGGAFYGKHGHDVAALKIITEEAGGKATDLNGADRRYDQDGLGCVVSNGILHREILNCISAGKL